MKTQPMSPHGSNEPRNSHPFPSIDKEQKLAPNPTSKVTNGTASGNPDLDPEPRRSSNEESAPLRSRSPSSPNPVVQDFTRKSSTEVVEVINGRERLKRHRVEVAGRVWVPEMWGQEDLLKEWTDCTAFDASLVQRNILSARAALVEEGRIRA